MPTRSSEPDATLLTMAEEIFGISMIAWQARQHSKSTGGWDLSETEYLALDLLAHHDRQTVGQLQRHIGVLPAQMSRVVRALEGKFDEPLIQCSINPDDKRRVNVELTAMGRRAHQQFRQARLSQTAEMLSKMPREDMEEFMRLIRQIRQQMASAAKSSES